MGNKIPVITKAIKENELTFNGTNYTIKNDNSIVLNKEDILVNYLAKNDMPVLSDGEVVVTLNLAISEVLKEEGIAREIVRNIQDARKQLDLEIMDRISLNLSGNVPKNYVNYILNETLADLDDFDNVDFETEVEGVKIKIKAKKQ